MANKLMNKSTELRMVLFQKILEAAAEADAASEASSAAYTLLSHFFNDEGIREELKRSGHS